MALFFFGILYFSWTMLYGISTLSISKNPGAFTVNSAIAGQQPSTLTDTSSTYSYTTSATITVITGALNSNMPSGVTLTAQLAAGTGATSLGLVTMTTTTQNLVTGIPSHSAGSLLTITYNFTATVSAAQTTNATRTLTLTLQ